MINIHILKYNQLLNKSITYEELSKYENSNENEFPILLMDWVEGKTLVKYIDDNYRDSARIRRLAGAFMEMVSYLQSKGLAHGDLSGDNIIVRDNGTLCLIDYDSFYYYKWGNSIPQPTPGVKGYQHPGRFVDKMPLNEYMDNFSQQIIYLSLIAIAENPLIYNKQKVGKTTGMGILFDANDLMNVSRFEGGEMYRKIKAINNSDVQGRLAEVRRSLAGRLEDVRSIVDYIQPAPPKIDYDKEYWELNKGTVEGCRKYLNRYPSGRFSNEAKGIVATYEKAERERAARQADDRFWGSNRETIEGCRKYLSQYPSGRHTFEAKNKISELIKHRVYSVLGWSAGIVLFVLFNIWLFSLGKPSATPEEMAQVLKELREQFDSTNGKSTVELCAESQSMDCLEYIDGLIEKAEKMDGGNSDVKYYRNKYDEIKGGALRSIIKELDELFDNSKSTSTVELCVQSRSIDGLQYVNHLIARGESLDKKNKQIKSYRKQFDKLTKGIKI